MEFQFALHQPSPPLDRHVELLTFYAGYAPTHDREKLIPDGAIQIIVDLTDTPKKLYAGETSPVAVDFSRSWISGMQQRWIVIEAQRASSMMVIRFHPGGAFAFMRHESTVFTNSVHALESVINGRAGSLRDRILEAGSIDAKFAATEAWLLEQCHGELALNPAAVHLAARLGQPGQRVADLVETTGLSDRQVRYVFDRWIGVSPKSYARIARFRRVLTASGAVELADPGLTSGPLPQPDWAALAAATGYSDQSHLHHDFVAFAGMTPGAYASAYRGLSNYLPITLPR
jgi:methylphosphotriester-DNA--protein-cysteine methyltransferase